MHGAGVYVQLHEFRIRPFFGKLLAWLWLRPIIVRAYENQQRRDDRTLEVGRARTVDRDHGDDLPSRVRKLLSQERERRVVARDAHRAARSMRNPKDRDLVGPDV